MIQIKESIQGVQCYNKDDFSGQFEIFKTIFFCFIVAIFDLVHDVETMYDLC